VEHLVEMALEEDLGRGDVTTQTVLLEPQSAEARIVARRKLVICGLDLAAYIFARVDPAIQFSALMADGDDVEKGQEVAVVPGPASGLLAAERLALNFLMRLSGIATLTRKYVRLVTATGSKSRVCDTRKTLPGWRVLDKYAVVTGGGSNHRMDLGSGVLIKDNHISACGSVWEAVQRARKLGPHNLRIQVEVRNLEELDQALEAGADGVLLDNMELEQIATAVSKIDGRALTEVSGGVDLDTVAKIALTDVDMISVGRLTHSAPAVDLALELNARP
jgi:nicotinate-nucleotide pyrophosphorylase (carboxylating)